jgi:outer membrane protein
MLKITTERKRGKLILSVEGRLAGPWVATLEQCWRELHTGFPKLKFSVNLCAVSFIDAAGRELLQEIHRRGAQLLAEGCLNQEIIRKIVGCKKGTDRDKSGPGGNGSHIIFYGFLFFALLLPGRLAAQQSAGPAAGAPSGVLRLTLDQVVALALKQNTTAQIAVLTAAQSEQEKNVARAALLPQAQLTVDDAARRLNLETGFGRRFPGLPQHAGPFQVFNAGSSFGAPVLDLTLWRKYQAARETARAERATSLSVREEVVLVVVSQYIATLRAEASVRASDARVALAGALYELATDLQKAGAGTGLDTLRANVELQNEKQRLLEAQAERTAALYGLSRLLNLDPRQEIELADAMEFFDAPQPELNASLEQALGARPEWQALEAKLSAARDTRKAASAARLPSLRFDGNWAYSGVSSATGIPVYNYQASVNVPLFTGGRIHAEVARAGLEIQKLEQQQADLRNEIAREVKTALVNLNAARSEVQLANLSVQLATEEVAQSRDRFQAGVSSNIEVISAQAALERANDNQIAAVYRFNQARAELARATGRMEKLYAK